MTANAFPAQYPGRCLCGASFPAGARIYWDSSVRRATGCPACAPRKMVAGPARMVRGLVMRFHRHPDTGLIVAVEVREQDGGWRDVDMYRLADGEWSFASSGGFGALTRPVGHDVVLRWIEESGEDVFATPAALAA